MGSRKFPVEKLNESKEPLTVGDETCTYVEVRDVLYHCASSRKLWNKLIDVARSLEISTDSIVSVEKRIKNDSITHPSALVEILEAWRGQFSADAKLINLINVLETNGLADCADSLRIHFNEFDDVYVVATLQKLKSTAKSSTWENLPERLKQWMHSKSVEFQGNEVELEHLTAQIATPVDEKILDELGAGKTPCVVNNSVPGHLEYYVHRTVRSRNVLKIDVFKEKCKDVFVIEGMEKHQLSQIVPDNESTDVSGNQLERLTVRFILLQHASDFDKIIRIASTPVHLVKYENGRLEFVKSSGTVVNLQKHIHDSQDSFLEEGLACRPERVVVIADSPGMGKTCLLGNIAQKIMRKQPTMLVQFIVLKEFVDSLRNKKVSRETIVNVITEKSSEYEFGRKLVENALKTQKCVLLFDGLDEVLSNQMTTAMEILKAAATLPSAQVFVATRPHYRDDVETQLNVLGYTIQPFDESNQINFLVKFWTTKGAIGNDELAKFTKDCVSKLSSNMTDKERNIAGIPLQCRLLAEAYEEHAIRCSKAGYKNYGGADSVVMISSIFKIYERHMEMRFETIRKEELVTHFKSYLTRKGQYETIKQAHMYFALELLFPEHSEAFGGLNSSSIPLHELCGLGILEATHSNDIRFVHRTFAEFLVAMLAHEYIHTTSPLRDILLSSILNLNRKKSYIKTPFDSTWGANEIESFSFNFPVICYFLNGFAKNETTNKLGTDYHVEALPYYTASAYHNYENIPQLVSQSVKNITRVETDQLITRNLFYVTAMHSGLELMKLFCAVIDFTQIKFMSIEKSNKSVAFTITPLHLAVNRGHYTLVDYLVKKLEGKVIQLCYLIHFCVWRSENDSNAIVEDKIQIIKLLVRKNRGLLDEQLIDLTTPLMQYYVHVELLECLVQQGANLNIRDEYRNTMLHIITDRNKFTPESYHRVLIALDKRGFQDFNEPDSKHITPIHRAVQKIELLSSTLKLFISKGADFNVVDADGGSVLIYAIRVKRSVKFISKLINLGAETKHRNWEDRNVLHICGEHGNFNAMEYFIENDKINVNHQDRYGNTPLHLTTSRYGGTAFEELESIQLLLINSGADVNAENKLHHTPFMESFQNNRQLSLTVIKEMEKHGLIITPAVASKAITGAFLQLSSYNYHEPKMHLNVFEYLIEKGGYVDFEFTDNFWKWEVVQKRMPKIIAGTSITSEVVKAAQRLAILTQQQHNELNKLDELVKGKRFYEMVQKKSGSFERVYMILREERRLQSDALEELRQCLKAARGKLRRQIFGTPPPGLKQLMSTDNPTVIALLTNSTELSVTRIRETIGEDFEVVYEHELQDITDDRKVVLKCDNVTSELVNKLVSLKITCVCVCKTADDGVQDCQIINDTFVWGDLSSGFVDKLRFQFDVNWYYVNDLFASTNIVGEMVNQGGRFEDDNYSFTVLKCKLGQAVKKQDGKYLSTSVFSYFLPDKLVFLKINEHDLMSYAKYGQKIGIIGETLDLQHDYMVAENNQMDLIGSLCKQTTSNVHLIEYNEGGFKIMRTWGSEEHIARFFETTQSCQFPFCECPISDNILLNIVLAYYVTKKGERVKKQVTCDVNEVLPQGRRILEIQEQIDLFEMRKLVKHTHRGVPEQRISTFINQMDAMKTESESSRYDKMVEIIFELVTHLQLPVQDKDFQQVGINTLFPHLAKAVGAGFGGIEECIHMRLIACKNNFLVFNHDVLATYFIAEMIISPQDLESLSRTDVFNEVLLKCFYSHVEKSCWRDKLELYTKEFVCSKFSNKRLFKFLDFFASKLENHEPLSTLLSKVISPQSRYKWVQATVIDNLFNLLKIIVELSDDVEIFESEDIVVLAVNHGDAVLLDFVAKQFKNRTKKELNSIQVPLWDWRYGKKYLLLSLLDVAGMKCNTSVFEYLLKHHFNNTLPQMQDIIYNCFAETQYLNQVDESIQFINYLIQTHPECFYSTMADADELQNPLLVAPNINVDLIIHAINLGVNVHAVNERKENVLHRCAEYLTPPEYERVVNELVEKKNTKLFHSRDVNQNTPLHIAVKNLVLLDSTIQLFASAKVEYNAVNEFKNTALHYAVVDHRSARVLDSLIKAGADEEARGRFNRTVLHIAAESGNLTALKYFILRGHDVNATDQNESTPLHLAMYFPKEHTHEVVVLLGERGADVNAINKFGRTPLSIANGDQSKVEARTKKYLLNYEVQRSIVEVESLLLKWESDVIRVNMEKLSTLTRFDSRFLQKLISSGIFTEPEKEELESMETGSSRATKFYTTLLTKKYDFKILLSVFSDSNNTPVLAILVKELINFLYNCVLKLEVPGVHYLIHTKTYTDFINPIVQALEETDRQAFSDKWSIVQLICTLKPEVLPPKRTEMYTPMQVALLTHHEKQLEFIQKIISHHVDVNERDSKGWTPLHYAVRQKPVPPRVVEIVKLLIESGADPDVVDEQGCTFLHRAPEFLSPDLYHQLIAFFDSSGRRDSLKLCTNHNFSHLHCAVENYDPLPTTLDILKANGIDFNGQDNDGDCVVFDAIEGGRDAKFLRTLLSYGADWRIPNNKQENALHLAALFGNVSALELFISLGCDVNAKNIFGRTPLHNAFLATKNGKDIMTNHEIVVLLLEQQVDVAAKDADGKTPVDLARERLHNGKVKQATVEVLEKYLSK